MAHILIGSWQCSKAYIVMGNDEDFLPATIAMSLHGDQHPIIQSVSAG